MKALEGRRREAPIPVCAMVLRPVAGLSYVSSPRSSLLMGLTVQVAGGLLREV